MSNLCSCTQHGIHITTIDIVTGITIRKEDAADFVLLGQFGQIGIVFQPVFRTRIIPWSTASLSVSIQSRSLYQTHLHCPEASWFPVHAVSKKFRWTFFLGAVSIDAAGILVSNLLMAYLTDKVLVEPVKRNVGGE